MTSPDSDASSATAIASPITIEPTACKTKMRFTLECPHPSGPSDDGVDANKALQQVIVTAIETLAAHALQSAGVPAAALKPLLDLLIERGVETGVGAATALVSRVKRSISPAPQHLSQTEEDVDEDEKRGTSAAR